MPLVFAYLIGFVSLVSGPTSAAPLSVQPRQRLNDTGSVQCVAASGVVGPCPDTGQDGEFGRDVLRPDASNGDAGFSFTKICNSGELAGAGACPSNPALGAGSDQWGCTLDRVTSRLWEIKTNDGGLRDANRRYTNYLPGWDGHGGETDAAGFVADVNANGLCGVKGWRLPDRLELQSIVNFGTNQPASDLNFFDSFDLTGTPLWTSTGLADIAAWTVDFGVGRSHANADRRDAWAVRLVRFVAEVPPPRYDFSSTGAEVLDRRTGLVWRRCSEGQVWDGMTCAGTPFPFVWMDTFASAKAAGKGWRVPNIKELSTLVDDRASYPAIDSEAFPGTPDFQGYWSSTPLATGGLQAWLVNFWSGDTGDSPATVRLSLRLVRSLR
jgi:Protein of unknown function (DUF1566)